MVGGVLDFHEGFLALRVGTAVAVVLLPHGSTVVEDEAGVRISILGHVFSLGDGVSGGGGTVGREGVLLPPDAGLRPGLEVVALQSL